MRQYSFVLLLGLIALTAEPMLAQPRIEAIDIGFNGRFLPGAWTPIVVSLSNTGTTQVFTMEVSQEVRDFNERSSVERLRLPVSLSTETRKNISFDFSIKSVSAPLQVKLFAGPHEIAFTEIDIRERWSESLFSLGVASHHHQMPYWETVEPEKLPKRWTSYQSVQRVYWGRLDPGRLSADQRAALYGWLLRGGELIVLSGDNWYEQSGTGATVARPSLATAHGWWAHLMPIAHGRVVRREFNGQEVSWLEGDLRAGARVAEEADGRPIVWELPIGSGKVLLVALDALPSEVKLLESSSLYRKTVEDDQLIVNALGAMTVRLPSREILSALLILFVVGIGLSGLWAVRHARGALWVAFSAVVLSLVLFGYLHSPEFSKDRYSLDLGVLLGWQGEPLAWEQSWYGVFFRRSHNETLAVSSDSAKVLEPMRATRPSGDVSTEITPAGARYLRFRSERESARFFKAERTVELLLDFSIDRTVSPPRVRVYNQTAVPLQDAVVQIGEEFYKLGTIAAQAELVRPLTAAISKSEWLQGLSLERRALWQRWGSSLSGSALLGWTDGTSPWAMADNEERTIIRLVLIEGAKGAE
jgi:hypothetical protein